MPLYVLFFDSTVKLFDKSIAFRVTWIVVEVNDRAGPDIHTKVFIKFISVVCLDMFNRERSHMQELMEEVFGVSTGQSTVLKY